MDIWTILRIKATTDIAAIKKAYARRAAECHPEEDPKGFQELHEAYADAMEIARMRNRHNSESEEKPAPKAPVFRAAPKNLHKLGNARPADEEPASPLPKIVAPKGTPLRVGFNLRPSSPSPEDNAPQESPENAGEYQFKKGSAASAQGPEDMPPKEHMEGAEGYRFTQGGATETPPPDDDALPQEENTGSPPAYVFPPADGKPDEDMPDEAVLLQEPLENAEVYRFPKGGAANDQEPEEHPPQGHPEDAGEYQFPKGSPGAPPAPEPASPMRGGPPVTSTGTPLVFPGFMLPDVGADMGMPFMPFLSMAAAAGAPEQEQHPQTKEAAEHLQLLESARQHCLDTMRTLLEQDAPEAAWYPLLLGTDFTLIRYDGKFLLSLLRFCRKQLSMEMASALYMAYGFASDKFLRKFPVTAPLHTVLNEFLQLPQGSIPFLSLSENLHRSDKVLAGLARLCAASREPFVCDQAVRTPAFVHVKHQPYFLLKLAAFLETNDVAKEWRQALAQAYQFRELPESSCLRTLAEQLPVAAGAPDQTSYNPAADNLLLDESALDAFFTTARENMLDLLEKTRKGFPQSTRREPWEHVFTRPEFALVRRDALFLAWVLFFLKNENVPVGIWPTLADAYSADFAALPQEPAASPEPSPEASPEERTTAYLMMLRHALQTHKNTLPENPSFWNIIKSMLRSI